jgi:hypothetical protein
MDGMTTVVVVTLTLVGVGIVVDRLFWLRRWLNQLPPDQLPEPFKPPE